MSFLQNSACGCDYIKMIVKLIELIHIFLYLSEYALINDIVFTILSMIHYKFAKILYVSNLNKITFFSLKLISI